MGLLRASEARGKEVFAFEYDREWLRRESFRDLDPDLQLYEGPLYLDSADRPNFGLFLDSSPGRWGRLLMRRREAVRARAEGRPERRLQEIDFVLGVHDEQRVGGMRFRETSRGDAWQCDDPTMVTPPWTSLRELEHASWQLQRDDAEQDPHYREWLSLLMAPSSSLGGARPKAGVRGEQGELWIAKFPPGAIWVPGRCWRIGWQCWRGWRWPRRVLSSLEDGSTLFSFDASTGTPTPGDQREYISPRR